MRATHEGCHSYMFWTPLCGTTLMHTYRLLWVLQEHCNLHSKQEDVLAMPCSVFPLHRMTAMQRFLQHHDYESGPPSDGLAKHPKAVVHFLKTDDRKQSLSIVQQSAAAADVDPEHITACDPAELQDSCGPSNMASCKKSNTNMTQYFETQDSRSMNACANDCDHDVAAVAHHLGHAQHTCVPLGSAHLAAVRSALVRPPGNKSWERAAAGSQLYNRHIGAEADQMECGSVDNHRGWMQARIMPPNVPP